MPSYNLFNSPIMQAAWQDPVNAEFLRGTVQAGGAPQLQEALAEEQAQTNFNRDMANAALMSEMANRGAYNTEPQAPAYQQGLMPSLGASQAQATQEQVQPQPQRMPLNQLAKIYADQIVQAKGYYDQAEQAGNTEAMMQAHNAAEQARAGLQQLGVDPAAYGLNGTYQEAQQAMASNNLQAMQNILAGDMSKSSIANYDDTYNYLINQGYSREIAAEIAGQKARSYAVQRTQELENAFNMYGHDGKVINPIGVQILQKLAEEEPDMANYYVQRYAGPLQEYADAKQLRNMATQQANKKEIMAIGHGYELDKMDKAQAHRIQIKNIEAAQREAASQNDWIRAAQLEVLKAQVNGKGGSSSGQKPDYKYIDHLDKIIKEAADWDKEHIGQEKDNPYRQDANNAISVRRQLMGLSQGDKGKDYDLDDYDQAREWVQDIINQNAAKPPAEQLDKQGIIVNLRKGLGYGPMADNIINNIEWGDGANDGQVKVASQTTKHGVWSGNAYS